MAERRDHGAILARERARAYVIFYSVLVGYLSNNQHRSEEEAEERGRKTT